MFSFLAMILSMRVGLAPGPGYQATMSLREEAVSVAAATASDAPRAGGAVSVPRLIVPVDAPERKTLTREDWVAMLTDALSNQTLANAAMWVANQPVNVTVSHEKFFVSVRIATP